MIQLQISRAIIDSSSSKVWPRSCNIFMDWTISNHLHYFNLVCFLHVLKNLIRTRKERVQIWYMPPSTINGQVSLGANILDKVLCRCVAYTNSDIFFNLSCYLFTCMQYCIRGSVFEQSYFILIFFFKSCLYIRL